MTLHADETELGSFCRSVRARSNEHRRALGVLAPENLYVPMASVLRQELDSMIRVIFLLERPSDRVHLLEQFASHQKWTREIGGSRISDAQMKEVANRLRGWTASVYAFGCAFVHLTNMHDYASSDPFQTMDLDSRTAILQHLRAYHQGAPSSDDVTFLDIAPMMPNVLEKIASNLECYLQKLERGDQSASD